MNQDECLDNKIALSEESIRLILQDFGQYREPIGEGVLKYLVEGGDDTILQQLRGYNRIPDKSNIDFDDEFDEDVDVGYPPISLRCQLLHTLTTQEIEFYYRLARTYKVEAENVEPENWGYHDWLSLFLMFLVKESAIFSPVLPLTLPPVITADLIESLLLRFGDAADTLARLVFLGDIEDEFCLPLRLAWIGVSLPDFRAYSLKHSSVIREALCHRAVKQRIHALEMLGIYEMSLVPLASLLVDRATANSKAERAAALTLMSQDVFAMLPFVQAQAQTGKATERAHTARLLMDLIGVDARPFLEQWLETEKTVAVSNAIEQVLFYLAILSAPEPEILLSPLPTVVLEAALPASVRETIQMVLNPLYEPAPATHEEHNYQQHPNVPLSEDSSANLVDRLFECLQFGTVADCVAFQSFNDNLICSQIGAHFRQLLQLRELEIIHVLRLLLLSEQINISLTDSPISRFWFQRHWKGRYWKDSENCKDLKRWCQSLQPDNSLRYLASGLQALGLSGDEIAWEMLCLLDESPLWSWGEQAIWEYFAEHLAFFDLLFELEFYPEFHTINEQTMRRRLLGILEMFPQLPNHFIPLLWDIALNGVQAEKPLAQRCLDNRPGTQERLHQLVERSDPAIQIIAIQWLTRLLDRTAIPQMQAALSRQPTQTIREALLRGLEKLGTPIDEFLDRSQLLQESQTRLRKGIPQALFWFPFDRLPLVHWQDTGESVATEILTWLIVQSYQLKNPEPSPALRQYVNLWNQDERQQFGQFVLESWINQDTQVRSAVKERGILAVAGACGGAAMVPNVNDYLNTYSSKRLPQCRALLQVLTWSNDFAANQLLLTIANRFRPRKIQLAAQQCVQQLAQRQG